MAMFDLEDCENVVLINNKCPAGTELLKTKNCKSVVIEDEDEEKEGEQLQR